MYSNIGQTDSRVLMGHSFGTRTVHIHTKKKLFSVRTDSIDSKLDVVIAARYG